MNTIKKNAQRKKIGEKIEKKLREKMDSGVNALNTFRKNARREKNCTTG